MEDTEVIEKWKSVPLNTRTMAKLVLHACKTDDVSLMAHIISMAGQDKSSVTVQEILQKALTWAGGKNAMRCLAYILEQGADVSHLPYHYTYPDLADGGAPRPSREALELLVAHGWNVNTCALNGEAGIPLLWDVVGDRELVQWCLDHGADVNPPDHTPLNVMSPPKPLLETAAWVGDIDTFELLRVRGAPMHYGVFSNAIMAANFRASSNKAAFPQQMAMLRHLLDVVKCDANDISYGAHFESGSVCVNPLCWIACHPRPNNNTAEMKELICFLLDSGGDPDMTMEHRGFSKDDDVLVQNARESARLSHSHFFLEVVAD